MSTGAWNAITYLFTPLSLVHVRSACVALSILDDLDACMPLLYVIVFLVSIISKKKLAYNCLTMPYYTLLSQ